MNIICRSCGAMNSRVANADNCICTECGTPDDFEDAEQYQARMEAEEQARKDEAQARAEAEAQTQWEARRGRR